MGAGSVKNIKEWAAQPSILWRNCDNSGSFRHVRVVDLVYLKLPIGTIDTGTDSFKMNLHNAHDNCNDDDQYDANAHNAQHAAQQISHLIHVFFGC